MIVAVGFDLVEVPRLEAVWRRHRERFLARHFTPEEINYCLNKQFPAQSLAARFSAKEAFQKCWPVNHGWKDVWVTMRGRKPVLEFCPALHLEMQRQQLTAHLSLTNTHAYAAAVAVLERFKI
jgi:holo-[acyl-carrier protein] synthase